MDSYTSLLEKTRLPQPSLQKFAVISIFSKLRTAPLHLGPDSEPGSQAISQCLLSSSPAVVDQSVRELCRLVLDSNIDLSRALLELQSSLEGSDPKFVPLFVKSLGFLVCLGFERSNGSWKPESHEDHPFVKILSSRREVELELVNQVLLFMAKNKGLGMLEVCEFLRPFLNFSILRTSSSDSSLFLFIRQLISSMASFCCSIPNQALPIFRSLINCLKYFPLKSLEETRNLNHVAECMIESFIVVLRQLVGKGMLITEAQLCGLELIENVLSLYTSSCKQSSGREFIIELLKHILIVQKDLGLEYIQGLSSVILSLSVLLIESELEHQQLSMLKFLHFILKWKNDNEYAVNGAEYLLSEELLVIFPVIGLISSPSKSVKGVANDLLVLLERLLVKLWTRSKVKQAKKLGYQSISRPELIAYRLLQHLWFEDQSSLSHSFFLSFSACGTGVQEMHGRPRSWAYQLKELALWIVERRKSCLPVLRSQEILLTEMPLLLGAIAAVLVMHPSLGNAAIDALASIGNADPKLGVSLLLSVLFYNNIFTRKDVVYWNMLPKLLGMLPSLASQTGMIPFVVQTILPMLHKNANPVLYATATRLLCQTWEINDRAFGSLQGVLVPKGFTEFMHERNICISMAVSIRDVCRKNPDRGVDLILSVSACIESPDPTIQALGFQSLAYLCEADVIDFYTAWDVIAKYVQGYNEDPVLAYSACFLLRWGAMDADAYPDASKEVMNIVWGVGCSLHIGHELQWAKAKASAFEALIQYEIPSIVKNISNFKQMVMDLLLSETNPDVLKALEGLLVKIIGHEHSNRRRFVKEKKVPTSKIEKLLDVFPQVIFSSGKRSNAGELPGASLLCGSFISSNLKSQGTVRGLQDPHSGYEDMMVQIAASLHLSRNTFLALLSLESWKAFVRRWMRASILSIDAKASVIVSDKTSKAANGILKNMMQVAEESIPRSAENIGLAIGALCAVLPPSSHIIKSTASKFLLGWLFQYEHEHRQWSAAMSLGLISSSLHVTDHEQKFMNITGLLEVLCCSKSSIVKGACGIGLGFSCQDLLSRVEAPDDSNANEGNHKMLEERLLGRIVRTLSLMLHPVADYSVNTLESLCAHFSAGTDDMDSSITSDLLDDDSNDLDDDIWGMAGLVIGLGSSIGAIYRAGAYDAVLKVKELIISWIPHMSSSVQTFDSSNERSEILLSVGACLALPHVVAFCQRVEMVDSNELDHLINGYVELISDLLSVNKSGAFHKSLLMASTAGAGSLLSCILSEGSHFIEVERVKCLLELFRKCYSSPYPPIVHLGGMLGIVNAFGAGAGNLVDFHGFNPSVHTGYDQKDHSHISGPILANPACEEHSTSLMQEIFLVAQNSDDNHLQQYAAWAVSFLRNRLWSREISNSASGTQSESVGSKSILQGVPEDSAIMKLGLRLKSFNQSGTGTDTHICTVAAILRCLSLAPRLPTLDWGAIVRRCMRYEAQVTRLSAPDMAHKEGTLREECLQFALVHAKQFDALLTFLDELSDLSRFRTLELSLQRCLLSHLADLIKLFSGSRLEKLLGDVINYFSSLTTDQVLDSEEKSSLRSSCWKGLNQCLDEASLDSLEYIKSIERCMEVLFSFLPSPQSPVAVEVNQLNSVEWSEAVRCLAKARPGWLLDFLHVSHLDSGDVTFVEVLKRIQAKAKLVRIGSIPLTELGKSKSYLLNSEPLGTWGVLIEVVATLQHVDGSVKRQWLVDAVEISCVSSYPSTALQFIGLLSGSCCKYMPLLIADQSYVLNDLPVTLTSLLSDPNWEVIAESFTSYLLTSTERVYSWATKLSLASDDDALQSSQGIDKSENGMAQILLPVMHHACVCLKHFLTLDRQLRLANMVVNYAR
ncbi:ECERIFERUM 13, RESURRECTION1 [Hibiscus trionum]|uniref:ECERIFERUM 13, RESURRECTION1 n=1 Tax=Hibiscus trionum TaxID=183268 RepID=A0A9W7MP02_HIBTR|nr:ECERIFERUM 13, RESURRECTION1 [Hibiscus trionum]